MKRIIILLIIIITNISFSDISIDFCGATFSQITNNIEKLTLASIKPSFVIIDNPFRKLKDGTIYDFEYENENFVELTNYLTERKIEYYIYLPILSQPKSFNRRLWKITDFKSDSLKYSSNYLLDISSQETKTKLKNYLSSIRSKGYKIALEIPIPLVKEKEEIVNSLGSELDDSIILLSGETVKSNKKIVSDELYWKLRQKIFLSPEQNIKDIDKLPPYNGINLIGSDEMNINNLFTISYLLLKKENIMVNYKLLNSFTLNLISFIEKENFKRVHISKSKMIFTSKDKIFVLNFNEEFSAFETENYNSFKNGFFPSNAGGGFIEINNNKINFFLFPNSISYFLIR